MSFLIVECCCSYCWLFTALFLTKRAVKRFCVCISYKTGQIFSNLLYIVKKSPHMSSSAKLCESLLRMWVLLWCWQDAVWSVSSTAAGHWVPRLWQDCIESHSRHSALLPSHTGQCCPLAMLLTASLFMMICIWVMLLVTVYYCPFSFHWPTFPEMFQLATPLRADALGFLEQMFTDWMPSTRMVGLLCSKI